MPKNPNKAKPRPKITENKHLMSVECPKNARSPRRRVETAKQLRRDLLPQIYQLRSMLEKLHRVGVQMSKQVTTVMRKHNVIADSHPAFREFLSWERQFNDALMQAEKVLKV